MIEPSQVLYIKLGRSGSWEEDCIANGTLRLGYRETPHELCLTKQWDEVQNVQETIRKNKGTATSDKNQLRNFYEADERVLWVTFWKGSLWWCFSKPEVTQLEDASKVRPVIGAWSNRDINGAPLLMSQLSGGLLAMQGFQGTICSAREADYLINKINGVQPKGVKEAEDALRHLEQKVETIIRSLTWRDFELLIDLVFRQAGWQRVSDLGATMKSLDLDLISPITAERYGVQVKARASRALFDSYRTERLADMEGFTRFYFAVHTPAPDLLEVSAAGTEGVELLLPKDIARLSVDYGLTKWVLDKAR
ncbi:MAG: hypothetical protein M3511_07345 [Deinococcota bacterium]|jgi:hypothetical protein|nr:hypothetical protein [Deinococcota bacterium]